MMGRPSTTDLWVELRFNLTQQAGDSKSAQEATVELSRRYGLLDEDERAEVDRLLDKWVLSDVKAERFDALAIIYDHGVASAVPALRKLFSRLEESDEVGAPYEWAKVNRLLGRLIPTANE